MDARHLILAVQWGPLRGTKAALAPGQALRIGRTDLADLVVPGDAQMSALHCEVRWDGQRGALRDLESARGTLHNGAAFAPEHAGEIRHGDWIKVGETVLTVHFEGQTPPRPPVAVDGLGEAREARRAARAGEALAALRQRAPVYAVLDAARDRRILELCREAVEEHRSLYDGVEGDKLAHVAPYLVRLGPESRLLEALVREGWGRRWGIYLTSPRPPVAVRRHLRRFLMVEREIDHERLYFRFYDPAVLGAFLPVTRPLQRAELFREVEAFVFEGEGAAVTVATEGRD